MATGLTRTALDRMQCSEPGCKSPHGALYVSGRCHPGAPSAVMYENGTITVTCAQCDAVVAVIAVAR